MARSLTAREIQTLILSYHPIIVIETVEEERVARLLQRAAEEMGMPMFEWSVARGISRKPGTFNAPWDVGESSASLEETKEPEAMLKYIHETQKSIFWLKDLGEHLGDASVARQFREVAHKFSKHRAVMVVTGESVRLPGAVAGDAAHCELKLPDREELARVVKEVGRTLSEKNRVRVELDDRAEQSLVSALCGMTLKQARQVLAYAALEDGQLCAGDVPRILKRKSQMIHEASILEYHPVENLSVAMGGFVGLKRWLTRAKVGFSPAARELRLPAPKGILIVGIQGCGKSLAAKAIARAWQMPLLKLDAGRLYDKYIGESEKNFRQAVTLAESIAPAVLWIDEIEKSFGASSGEGDGGLSQRLFGSFLTWLQEKSEQVFVVATANDISRIPPELLRKGRFDEIFFVDLPNAKERASILSIHLQKHRQQPEKLDMAELVQASDGFSGAEMEQAIIAALYEALAQGRSLDTALLVTQIKEMIPLSVSRREDLQRLRAIAKERFLSAG